MPVCRQKPDALGCLCKHKNSHVSSLFRGESQREVHSVRASAEQSVLFVDYQVLFLSQPPIASSSDLLPETLARSPVPPSHSHYAASRRPFQCNFVSGPDLPSPCSLIFSLSPYSTFLPAPSTPNPPVTRRPHLLPPFILLSQLLLFPHAWSSSPKLSRQSPCLTGRDRRDLEKDGGKKERWR